MAKRISLDKVEISAMRCLLLILAETNSDKRERLKNEASNIFKTKKKKERFFSKLEKIIGEEPE